MNYLEFSWSPKCQGVINKQTFKSAQACSYSPLKIWSEGKGEKEGEGKVGSERRKSRWKKMEQVEEWRRRADMGEISKRESMWKKRLDKDMEKKTSRRWGAWKPCSLLKISLKWTVTNDTIHTHIYGTCIGDYAFHGKERILDLAECNCQCRQF